MASGKTKGLAQAVPPSMLKDDAEFRAQDDLRALSRAEEIRADPSRMRHARRHLRKQTKLLTRPGAVMGRR
jgi:hypothetical protein